MHVMSVRMHAGADHKSSSRAIRALDCRSGSTKAFPSATPACSAMDKIKASSSVLKSCDSLLFTACKIQE